MLSRWSAAADQGEAAAQTRLGIANATGWGGFSVNDFAAFRYFTQAAEQGFGEAICWVAECFAEGRGVERSAEQAYAQYAAAAAMGLPEAQHAVGVRLLTGDGAALEADAS